MERMTQGKVGPKSAPHPELSPSIARSLTLAIIKTQPGLSKQKRAKLIAALEQSWAEQEGS